MTCDWSSVMDFLVDNAFLGSGYASSISANRVSFTLGLTGPSAAVDTAEGLVGHRMTEAEVDSFVTSADANGDGRINYEEFVAANRARLHLDEGPLTPKPVSTGLFPPKETVTANADALDRATQLKV